MSQNVSQCPTAADDLKLDDRQVLALELILSGKPDTQVAREVGVNRRTIARWRSDDQAFVAELFRRRRERWCGIADKLRALLDPAVDVLAAQLTDQYDRTRFRAASTLLRLADVKSLLSEERENR